MAVFTALQTVWQPNLVLTCDLSFNDLFNVSNFINEVLKRLISFVNLSLYAARDTKREMFLVGGTNKVHTVTYDVEIGKDLSFLQVRSSFLASTCSHNPTLL